MVALQVMTHFVFVKQIKKFNGLKSKRQVWHVNSILMAFLLLLLFLLGLFLLFFNIIEN